jgi:hypothetical protein
MSLILAVMLFLPEMCSFRDETMSRADFERI